jgi:hypothetical protein
MRYKDWVGKRVRMVKDVPEAYLGCEGVVKRCYATFDSFMFEVLFDGEDDVGLGWLAWRFELIDGPKNTDPLPLPG